MEQSLINKDKLVESMVWRDDQGMILSIDDVLDTIENAPTIDPESLRPRGHWEGFQADGKDDRFEFTLKAINICSKCKHISMQKSKYCPNCGAKMEEESDGKTE